MKLDRGWKYKDGAIKPSLVCPYCGRLGYINEHRYYCDKCDSTWYENLREWSCAQARGPVRVMIYEAEFTQLNTVLQQMQDNQFEFDNKDLQNCMLRAYAYDDYVNELLYRNGPVKEAYVNVSDDGLSYTKNCNVTRQGFEVHHIGENKIAELSSEQNWCFMQWQQAEVLCYANYIEHAILHYLITKEDQWGNLGWGGLFNHHMLKRTQMLLSEKDYVGFCALVFLIRPKLSQLVLNMLQGKYETTYSEHREARDLQLYRYLLTHYSRGINYIDVNCYNELGYPVKRLIQCNIEHVILLRSVDDTMMFMGHNSTKNQYYILNGGSVAKCNHKPEWYLYKMPLYKNKCDQFTQQYIALLEPISTAIKQAGGTGRIHGLIVDYDFFTHIKLDIDNARFIAYSAPSTSMRTCFSTVNKMLEYNAPKQITSSALVQVENTLSKYENKMNIIGLTTPLFEEETKSDMSAGWYTGNNRVLRIARASITQILTSWEKFWDEDSSWAEEHLLLTSR